jgi:small conductance mechanosensitive channel
LILTEIFLAIEIDRDEALDLLLTRGGRVLLVLAVILVLLLLIQRFISPLVRVAIREQMEGQPEVEVQKRISTLSHVIYRTLLGVLALAAVLMILPEFGVSVGPLVAGVGLIGIAVGFGAQSLVKDVISGVFILLENQYGIGDVVELAGTVGLVEDINLRRTVLRDLDGTVHFVPHGLIDRTSNMSKGFARVNLNVGVAYDSDLEHVFAVINRVGQELAHDPQFGPLIREAPQVERVDGFLDSSIEIKVLGTTEPIQQWAVTGELRRRLKLAFDEEKIAIPFPRRDIHLFSAAQPADQSGPGTGKAGAPLGRGWPTAEGPPTVHEQAEDSAAEE